MLTGEQDRRFVVADAIQGFVGLSSLDHLADAGRAFQHRIPDHVAGNQFLDPNGFARRKTDRGILVEAGNGQGGPRGFLTARDRDRGLYREIRLLIECPRTIADRGFDSQLTLRRIGVLDDDARSDVEMLERVLFELHRHCGKRRDVARGPALSGGRSSLRGNPPVQAEKSGVGRRFGISHYNANLGGIGRARLIGACGLRR